MGRSQSGFVPLCITTMSQISAAQYAFPHDPFTFPPSFQSSSDSSPLSPILQASQLAYFDASSPSESSSLALPTSNIHNNEKIDPNFVTLTFYLVSILINLFLEYIFILRSRQPFCNPTTPDSSLSATL